VRAAGNPHRGYDALCKQAARGIQHPRHLLRVVPVAHGADVQLEQLRGALQKGPQPRPQLGPHLQAMSYCIDTAPIGQTCSSEQLQRARQAGLQRRRCLVHICRHVYQSQQLLLVKQISAGSLRTATQVSTSTDELLHQHTSQLSFVHIHHDTCSWCTLQKSCSISVHVTEL